MEQSDKKLELLKNQCNLLRASFDSVLIFTTKHEGDNTSHFTYGDGNWFAQYGQVIDWLNKQDRKLEDGD